MKIIKSESKSWLGKEGFSKKVLLRENNFGKFSHIQEIKIKSGERAEEHYHKKQTEIFYFPNKNGYWIVNGKKINPGIGDVLVIEPFDKHKIVNNSLKDYVYLVVKFNYDPNDSYLK